MKKLFLLALVLAIPALTAGEFSARVELELNGQQMKANLRTYYPTVLENFEEDVLFEIFAKVYEIEDKKVVAVQVNEYSLLGKFRNVSRQVLELNESYSAPNLSIPFQMKIIDTSLELPEYALVSQCCLTCSGWTFCGCAVECDGQDCCVDPCCSGGGGADKLNPRQDTP